MTKLHFISNATSPPRLKVYDEGYITFVGGRYQMLQQFGDEFCAIEESSSDLGYIDAKAALVAYCQIVKNPDALVLLLSDFRHTENLKFLTHVFGGRAVVTFENPQAHDFSCEGLPSTRSLFSTGLYVNTSTDSTWVTLPNVGTFSYDGVKTYQRLFAIYFSLYLAGRLRDLPKDAAGILHYAYKGG